MATAADVAGHIAGQLGLPVSAMRVHRLAYYCHAWHLVWEEQPLFTERIEAWASGPVVPDLYALHRGVFVFTADAPPPGEPTRLTATERETVHAVLAGYGKATAHELSELSTREPPWREPRRRARLDAGTRGSVPMTNAEIFEFFDGLTATAGG